MEWGFKIMNDFRAVLAILLFATGVTQFIVRYNKVKRQ